MPAHDAGDEAAAWLSSALGAELRLVRFDPVRIGVFAIPIYAGDSGAHTAFADGYPLLVVAEASLADLNRRLEANGAAGAADEPFPSEYRARGIGAVRRGPHRHARPSDGVTMKLVKPCARCQITTTDQDSGQVGDEPLQRYAATAWTSASAASRSA